MNKLYIIILSLFIINSSVVANTALFEKGNEEYAQKEYAKAIESYSQILETGIESSAIYFNLGNAYFKEGNLGYAILYYSKAKRMAPADQAIRHNLEFAQRFSSVQMEGVELNPMTSFMASLVDSYTLSFLAWVASFIFILFSLAMIFRFGLGYNNSYVRVSLVVSLLFVMITSGLTTFKYRHDFLTRRAVLIAEQPIVYTGASEQSDIELEGAPGLIVEIISESTDYYNVLFENKRRGWVKKALIAEF